jgi:hypothetical protein
MFGNNKTNIGYNSNLYTSKGINLINILALGFQNKVISDGGTFEAINCLSNTINQLQALNQIATSFNIQVLNDNGTFEEINCLQTTITNLQNININ